MNGRTKMMSITHESAKYILDNFRFFDQWNGFRLISGTYEQCGVSKNFDDRCEYSWELSEDKKKIIIYENYEFQIHDEYTDSFLAMREVINKHSSA